jgi:hypothetical protein
VEQLAQALAERLVPMILQVIDINAIVDQVDIEKIIDRVDINAIVSRVDINAIVDKLDIDTLVEQTEIGSIIAHSTTGVLTEVLDVIRAQGVGLDDFVFRWGNRLIGRRRKAESWPEGPPLLVEPKVPA